MINNRGIKNDNGYVMTLMVVILASIMLVVVTSASYSSLTSLKKSQTTLDKSKIHSFTEGCSEEALLQLSRKPSYKGDKYDLRGGTCNIGVTTSDNTSTISVTGTLSNMNHNYRIEVSLDPFKVIKWRY